MSSCGIHFHRDHCTSIVFFFFCLSLPQLILLLNITGIIGASAGGDNKVVPCGAEAEKSIGHCLEPMLAYANAIQIADNADAEDMNGGGGGGGGGHSHFSLQGPKVFHRLCALYDDFKECTAPFQCQSLSVQAVDASYSFMCGSGQHEFHEHADCFARVENRPDYIKCRSEAAEAMDKVAANQQKELGQNGEHEGENQAEGQQSQLCTAMANYLACCRPMVEKNCGTGAWALVARITRDSLRVSLPKCRLVELLGEG